MSLMFNARKLSAPNFAIPIAHELLWINNWFVSHEIQGIMLWNRGTGRDKNSFLEKYTFPWCVRNGTLPSS